MTIVQKGLFGQDKEFFPKGEVYINALLESIDIIKSEYDNSPVKHLWVFWSGGKDSTLVLAIVTLMINQGLLPRDAVSIVSIDTGIHHKLWLPYLHEVTELLNLTDRLSIIYGDIEGYKKAVEKHGVPYGAWGHKVGAYHNLKLKALRPYVRYLIKRYDYPKGYYPITLLGVRWEESRVRSKREKIVIYENQTQVSPILHWWGDQVYQALEDFGVPVAPTYKEGLRNFDCLCNWTAAISLQQALEMSDPDVRCHLLEIDRLSRENHGFGYGEKPTSQNYANQKSLFDEDNPDGDGLWLCSTCPEA